MGYHITTVKYLPEDLSYYLFLVGDYRNSNPINDLFRDDFNIIADRIGEDSAVIEQSDNSRVEKELCAAMYRFASSGTETALFFEHIFIRCPGLLIIDCHPNRLTENNRFLYFPFSILEETYSNTNELLADLTAFVKFDDKAIIKKTTKKRKLIKGIGLSFSLGVIALNLDLA